MGLRSAEKLSLPDPQFPYGDSRPCTNAAQNQQAPHRGQPPHSSRPVGSLPSALRPSPGPQGRAEPRADGRLPTHRTPRSTALPTPPPKRSPPSGPGAAGSAPAWAGTGSGTARSEPPQPGPGPVPTAAPTAPSRSRVRRQLPSSRGACAPLPHRARGEEHLPAGGDGGEQSAAALPHGIRSPIAGPPHCREAGENFNSRHAPRRGTILLPPLNAETRQLEVAAGGSCFRVRWRSRAPTAAWSAVGKRQSSTATTGTACSASPSVWVGRERTWGSAAVTFAAVLSATASRLGSV